jgi:tryptophan-rich sensory protein
MKSKWKTYAFWIVLSEVVGAASGLLSMDCMRSFNDTVAQLPLSPPGFLFPIVWTILYALMGIGAARVSMTPPSAERSRGLNLFVIQLAMNFLWSPVFFCLRAFGLAFFLLLGLLGTVIWMTLEFYKTDRPAAWSQIPYILWLCFAAYLNFAIWMLSR